MTDVVKSALESFGTRVFIDGPEVFLNPNAAQGFALIMHELATNAAKHGSLTAEAGTVSVHWSIDVSAAEPIIVFGWQERGGPRITPPNKKVSTLFCSNAPWRRQVPRLTLTTLKKGLPMR